MRPNKNENSKRIRITLSIPVVLNKKIVDSTTNKSRFIESFLLDYFNKCNLDTSKIKL